MKAQFPSQMGARVTALLKKFQKLRLMVAGDLIADEYIYGDSQGLSREAPVLILRYTHTDVKAGGAANAAHNAADLGAQVYPLGVVGEDEAGAKLLQLFKIKKMDSSGV